MTSLTGSTPQTLKGTVDPPTIGKALFGGVVQISTLSYVWIANTDAGQCTSAATFSSKCLGDPWARNVVATLVLCLGLWTYSLRTIPTTGTSDPSIVDRLWSVLPWLYCWHWYLSAPSPRLLLMTLLASTWGVRLTWNFYLKGGFSGGEDYRWAEIRTWPGFDRGWEAFNLVFICGFQQLVILAFVSPAAAVIGRDAAAPLNLLDAIAAILYLALVAGEAVADWQMLQFQTEKYRRINAKLPLGPYAKGFIDTGLWAYSRHPNYFCEVSMWWAFYLFTLAAGLPLINWTLSGCAFLTCLFVLPHASLDTTEALSSRKYAAFADYQKRVSRFVPLPPRASAAELPPMSLVDKGFVGWFVVGTFIAFCIDMEQVLISDPRTYGTSAATTPLWPPEVCARAVQWWGRQADALVLARPVWFQVAIWLEIFVQVPFYLLGIFAFVRRLDWIRIPAIVYSTVLFTIMPIVLGEQYYGEHATKKPLLVTAVYAAYVIMPALVLLRVWDPQVFKPPPKAGAGRAAASTKGKGAATDAREAAKSPRRAAKSPSRGRNAGS